MAAKQNEDRTAQPVSMQNDAEPRTFFEPIAAQ
jgi:hypothetical protein